MVITEHVVTLTGDVSDDVVTKVVEQFETLLARALSVIEDELRVEFGDVGVDWA